MRHRARGAYLRLAFEPRADDQWCSNRSRLPDPLTAKRREVAGDAYATLRRSFLVYGARARSKAVVQGDPAAKK